MTSAAPPLSSATTTGISSSMLLHTRSMIFSSPCSTTVTILQVLLLASVGAGSPFLAATQISGDYQKFCHQKFRHQKFRHQNFFSSVIMSYEMLSHFSLSVKKGISFLSLLILITIGIYLVKYIVIHIVNCAITAVVNHLTTFKRVLRGNVSQRKFRNQYH